MCKVQNEPENECYNYAHAEVKRSSDVGLLPGDGADETGVNRRELKKHMDLFLKLQSMQPNLSFAMSSRKAAFDNICKANMERWGFTEVQRADYVRTRSGSVFCAASSARPA